MKALNNWTVDPNAPAFPAVTIYVGDAVDENGRVWPGLASLVTAAQNPQRVFVGESAWSDAERHAWDLHFAGPRN